MCRVLSIFQCLPLRPLAHLTFEASARVLPGVEANYRLPGKGPETKTSRVDLRAIMRTDMSDPDSIPHQNMLEPIKAARPSKRRTKKQETPCTRDFYLGSGIMMLSSTAGWCHSPRFALWAFDLILAKSVPARR